MAISETRQITGLALNGHRSESEILGNIPLIVSLGDETAKRVDIVGGKGASLAELQSIPGIKVPEAFVITASLSDQILAQNSHIADKISTLDLHSLSWLRAKLAGNDEAAESWGKQIAEGGKIIEEEMNSIKLSPETENEISNAYNELCQKIEEENVSVAVRSSGVCEDGSEFSFAGQNETFLHKQGKEEVIKYTVECIASQFGARAIEYRNEARLKLARRSLKENENIENALAVSSNFSHAESRLAVVVQRMVNASVAGVGFSVDSTSGAPFAHLDVSYGLGESVVGGRTTPDSFDIDPRTEAIINRRLGGKEVKTAYVAGGTEEIEVPEEDRKRFSITDEKAKELTRMIAVIKERYGSDMDTEFAMDTNGEIYFVQARPETVASQKDPMIAEIKTKAVPEKVAGNAEVILKGGIVGLPGAAAGTMLFAETVGEAMKALNLEENKGKKMILATDMTTPEWVPAMKLLAGIMTSRGGKTCHAAIVCRELGIPCLVGVGEKNMEMLKSSAVAEITLDVGKMTVYKGILPLEEVGEDVDVSELLKHPTETVIGTNMAMPDEAKKLHALAELGDKFKISLLRVEFLLGEIGVHVRALTDFDNGKIEPDSDLYKKIADKIAGYKSGKDYYVKKLSEGIASIAAVFPNSEVVARTTDFKTNEYVNLLGGERYEVEEENPMTGVRGLVRSLFPENREAFKWELEAIKRARDMGYKNIEIMFPVVRDPMELNGSDSEMEKEYGRGFKSVLEIMKEVGMGEGIDDLKLVMMVEDPANVLRIEEFIAAGVKRISFGTNDLTQLILGVDRDNEIMGRISRYDGTNPAVIKAVEIVIRACKEHGVETGICGNIPSTSPEFARMLVEEGIDSIGVTPDRFMETYRLVKEAEERRNSQVSSEVLFTA